MKKDITIIPVDSMDDILKHALVKPLVPIEWTEQDKAALDAVLRPGEEETDVSGVLPH